MKKLIFQLPVYVFIFIFALCTAQPVLAHGSEPRLEISTERINPGGVLDVRGVDFDYEQSVTLYLERTGILIQLGELVTDLEGVFVQNVVLPVDLPEGVYNIRAVADHHELAHARADGLHLGLAGSDQLLEEALEEGVEPHRLSVHKVALGRTGVVKRRL
jgi:hypothetical protein